MSTFTNAVRRRRSPPSDPSPSSYELVTRTRLDDLVDQVNRIESKLNAILVAVLVALAVELLRAALR